MGIFGSPQEKLTLIDQYFHITMVTEYSLLFLGPPQINLLSWIIQAPQKDSDSLEAFTSLHLFLSAPGDFFFLSLCYILDIFYLQEPHRGKNNLRSLALVFKVSLAAGVCVCGGRNEREKKRQICKRHAYVYSVPLQTANLFVFSTVASAAHSLWGCSALSFQLPGSFAVGIHSHSLWFSMLLGYLTSPLFSVWKSTVQ